MSRPRKYTDDNIANADHKNTKHGLSRTRFYRIWISMKQRCLDSNIPAYKNYGGRGIGVCERWMDFNCFYEDMFDSYQESLHRFGKRDTTIDRIDVNGGYTPENCRWATRSQQAKNTRKQIRPGSNFRNSTDAARIRRRIRDGWSREDAVKLPPNPRKGYKQRVKSAVRGRKVIYEGVEIRIIDLERKYNLTSGLIYQRLRYGWTLEEAVTSKKWQKGKSRLEGDRNEAI